MQILAKISLLLACSLAHNRDSPLLNHTLNKTATNACQRPCQDIEDSMQTPYLILLPTALGVSTCILTLSTIMLLRAKTKPKGVSATLWAVFLFWIHFLITSTLYQNSQRAQAYVWSLHATSQTLFEYGSLLHSQNPLPAFGILSTTIFAWLFGPPVSLVSWHSHYHAQCGWSLHCLALIGIETVNSLLSSILQLVQFLALRLD